MARNRINYQSQQLFVGPSPATGCHFIDLYGNLNNNFGNATNNNNLLFPIDRIQNISWEVTQPRQNIRMLGKIGSVIRPAIETPEANLSFEYCLIGVRNEARLGLNVNYLKIKDNQVNTYNNNFIPILSGFYDRNLDKEDDKIWPYTYKDCKNFFVAVSNEGIDAISGIDLENFGTTSPSLVPDLFSNSNSINLGVFGFGNCYMNSYNVDITVGQIPKASVNYVCENINFNTSGSGILVPGIETKSGINNTIKFVLPQVQKTTTPSVLLPSDVTLTITDSDGNSPVDFGHSYSDIKINKYSLNLGLERDKLRNFGYKYPIDRPINFPVTARISIEAIVGDLFSGSIEQLYRRDKDYNITLKIMEPTFTGVPDLRERTIPYNEGNGFAITSNYNAFGNNELSTDLGYYEFGPSVFEKGTFPDGLYRNPGLIIGPFSEDVIVYNPYEGVLSFDDYLVVNGEIQTSPSYWNFGEIITTIQAGQTLSLNVYNNGAGLAGVDPQNYIGIKPTKIRRISYQHDIRGAKLDSINYNSSIGSNNTINMNYSVDLYPDSFSTGLFISGLLHIDKRENYFHDGQGDYLSLFENDLMISDFPPLY